MILFNALLNQWQLDVHGDQVYILDVLNITIDTIQGSFSPSVSTIFTVRPIPSILQEWGRGVQIDRVVNGNINQSVAAVSNCQAWSSFIHANQCPCRGLQAIKARLRASTSPIPRAKAPAQVLRLQLAHRRG